VDGTHWFSRFQWIGNSPGRDITAHQYTNFDYWAGPPRVGNIGVVTTLKRS